MAVGPACPVSEYGFQNTFHTNGVESLAADRSRCAPKGIFFPATWRGRVACVAIKKNWGPRWEILLRERLRICQLAPRPLLVLEIFAAQNADRQAFSRSDAGHADRGCERNKRDARKKAEQKLRSPLEHRPPAECGTTRPRQVTIDIGIPDPSEAENDRRTSSETQSGSWQIGWGESCSGFTR
jgi:hypothetical protein